MEKAKLKALEMLTGGDKDLMKEIEARVDGVNRSAAGMINRNKSEKPAVKAAAKPATAKTAKPAASAAPVEREADEISDDEFDAFLDRIEEGLQARAEARKAEEAGDESEEAEEDGDDESAEEPAAEESAVVAEVRGLAKLIKGFSGRLTNLERAREEEQEEADEMPARAARTKTIIRPRNGNQAVTKVERRAEVKSDMSGQASSALEKLERVAAAPSQ